MNLFTQKELVDALEKAERRIKREKKQKEKIYKLVKFNGHKIIKMIDTHFLEVVIKIEVKDNNVEQALRVLKTKLKRWFF